VTPETEKDEASRLEVFVRSLAELRAEAVLAGSEQELESKLGALALQTKPDSVILAGLPSPIRAVVSRAMRSNNAAVEDLKPGVAIPTIERAEMSVTWGAYGVAKQGAVMELVYDDALRLASSLPINHVVLVSSKKILPDLEAAMTAAGREIASAPVGRRPSITFISGPSRTADIEGRLLYGAHGPHTLTVVVLTWL
jgi:L-lactate utilization protein LutC